MNINSSSKPTGKTLSVPKKYKSHMVGAVYALKVDKQHHLLPENVTDLVLDPDAEISHGDILYIVFKDKPNLYWIYKMVGQVSPRSMWRSTGGNAGAGILLESEDGDGFFPCDIAKIDRIHRVVCSRDSDGEYHSHVDKEESEVETA